MNLRLRCFSTIMVVLIIILTPINIVATNDDSLSTAIKIDNSIACDSAILIEQSTGKVLFEKDADVQLSPASITKIMTLLLVFEAIDAGKLSLEDKVTASKHANSMGGSQIWLGVGEQMTVHELIKATVVASANDAAVALAEHIGGSEQAFAEMMNAKAEQLGMVNTHFLNASGLDKDGHVTSARDISIMSAELLKHGAIIPYSTIWMDELRGGKTQLTNTNKLIRFYKGATGLKTGTTDAAGQCLSASASRDELDLIVVILGAKTTDERFNLAKGLLDYGFSNYKIAKVPPLETPLEPLKVTRGIGSSVSLSTMPPQKILIEKGKGENFKQKIDIPESIEAPINQGQEVGEVTIFKDGILVCRYPIITNQPVERMNIKAAISQVLKRTVRMGNWA